MAMEIEVGTTAWSGDTLTRAIPAATQRRDVGVDDWAIVGDKHYARDRLAQYVESLGLSHLIVRAGISGVSEAAQLHSHEQLLDVVSQC